MNAEEQHTVGIVLGNLLSSILKRDDVPFSSKTHEDSAICALIKLIPQYKFLGHDESLKVVLEAIEHILMYRKDEGLEEICKDLKRQRGSVIGAGRIEDLK